MNTPTEAVLRRHKLLTKYGLLYPMKAHAKMAQRGELLTPEQWRAHAMPEES